VLSSDPLAAALLGAAIELAGLAPMFPQSAESPRNALLRVRPRLVVIDCDHEDACTEAFVGPALMTGSQVVLFRSRRTQRDVSEMADRLGLRTVDMPREHDSQKSQLQELATEVRATHASATALRVRSAYARCVSQASQLPQTQSTGAASPKYSSRKRVRHCAL
jgi:hypothetical protein